MMLLLGIGHLPRPTRSLRRCSDRGVTMVTFALSIAAIFGVIVLVLGGSLGYTAERNSQTASDVAALAATTKLRNFQTGEPGVVAADVRVTALSVAEDNGADAGLVTCVVVEWDLDEVGPCTDANISAPNAGGIQVITSDTRKVPFGEVTGQTEIKGATDAAATIQPLASGTGPFMICYSAPGHPVEILKEVNPDEWEINEDAIDQVFVLHGEPIKQDGRDCGNPDNGWRGLVKYNESFPLPGEWGVEEGNKTGHLPRLLAGDNACGGDSTAITDFVGCEITVPLCISGNGQPANFELYCVGIGRFLIVWNGNGPSASVGTPPQLCHDGMQKHICGQFLGGGIVREGQGTNGPADPNEVAVIKLVE